MLFNVVLYFIKKDDYFTTALNKAMFSCNLIIFSNSYEHDGIMSAVNTQKQTKENRNKTVFKDGIPYILMSISSP